MTLENPNRAGARRLAVVTGASTGIGRELARICATNGFDLVIAADEPLIHDTAAMCEDLGAAASAVEADLATVEGVEQLYAAIGGRPVDALLANVGRGLGDQFLEQDFNDVRRVIDTNITGTIYLIQRIGRDMRSRGSGRILIVGSEAGYIPGAFHAVYNGTKAFINSFAFALREEIKDTGITVTLLMPGPTDTDFFERAEMEDTPVAKSSKDDPADVAEQGFAAMMKGEADVVTGWRNKVQTTVANVLPSELLAKMHRKKAEPDTNR
jgi:short-subunit dehydrogenase